MHANTQQVEHTRSQTTHTRKHEKLRSSIDRIVLIK